MNEAQMRKHLKRIWFHIDQLDNALSAAHTADLIKYDPSKYNEIGPCRSLSDLKERFKATSEKQIAEIIQNEVRRSTWRN